MVSDMVQNSSIKNLSLSTNLDQDQAIFDATFSETIQGQALYRLRFNNLKTRLSQDYIFISQPRRADSTGVCSTVQDQQ